MKTTFLLLGSVAVSYYNEGFNFLLEKVSNDNFSEYDIYKHKEGTSVMDLLHTADGWGGFIEIKEEEYKLLAETFCTLTVLDHTENKIHIFPIEKITFNDDEKIQHLISTLNFDSNINYQTHIGYPEVIHHSLLK